MNEKYEKIINMPHPTSERHARMKKSDRAAHFAPYAALSGYEDAVEETARLTDRRIELDEYEKERINSALTSLLSPATAPMVSITYFRPDKRKAGGAYVTVTGELYGIDEHTRILTLVGGYIIPLDEIIDVKMQDNSL